MSFAECEVGRRRLLRHTICVQILVASRPDFYQVKFNLREWSNSFHGSALWISRYYHYANDCYGFGSGGRFFAGLRCGLGS